MLFYHKLMSLMNNDIKALFQIENMLERIGERFNVDRLK